MKRRVLIRQVARRDLEAHAAFIARRSPRSALRFLSAAELAFRRLSRMPAIGAPYGASLPALKGIRRFRVKGFEEYLIFYRPLPDGIDVARVIHGARDIEAIFQS